MDIDAMLVRAGALALIGLTIAEGGQRDGDEVIVELAPVFIGDAARRCR